MSPTLFIDKPKIADVEKVKCNCCIRQVVYRLRKKLAVLYRLSHLIKLLVNTKSYNVKLFNDSSSVDMYVFLFQDTNV